MEKIGNKKIGKKSGFFDEKSKKYDISPIFSASMQQTPGSGSGDKKSSIYGR